MKLSELAEKIGAKIVANHQKAASIEVVRVYAGDNISDILNQVTGTTLLVTNLSHTLLPRVADLMDGQGICLVNGITPKSEMVEAATEHGIVLMVSPVGMFETCGRLYQVLNGKKETAR